MRARDAYSYLYTPPEGALPTQLGDMPLLISGDAAMSIKLNWTNLHA